MKSLKTDKTYAQISIKMLQSSYMQTPIGFEML